MLKVECEACKAPYQVDERRVPATGLKMRCPKCGHSFIVQNPAGAAARPAAPVPAPAAPSPTGQVNWDDYGKLVKAEASPAPAPAKPRAAAAPPAFGEIDLGDPSIEQDLPAARPEPPKAARPAPGPPLTKAAPAAAASVAPAKKHTMIGVQAPVFPPAAAAPSAPLATEDPFAGLDLAPAPPARQPTATRSQTMLGAGAPGLAPPAHLGAEDLDLPALASDAGLPAAAKKAPAKPPGPPPAKPIPLAQKPGVAPAAAARPAPSLQDFEIDLPTMEDLPAAKAPAAQGPGKKGGLTFDLDAAPGADLPLAKPAKPAPPGKPPAPGAKPTDAGLPVATKRAGGAFGDIEVGLPAAKGQSGGPSFGDIDLPMLGGNLPAVSRGVGLPAVANVGLPAVGGAGLPAVSGAGLPAVGGAGLPSVSGAGLPVVGGAGLPVVGGVGLPNAMDGQSHMPSMSGPGNSLLPSVGGNLPAALGDDRHMPMAKGEAEFGNLNLPRARGAGSYGEVDLAGGDGGAEAEIEALSKAAGGTLAPDMVRGDGDDVAPRRRERGPGVGPGSNRKARGAVVVVVLLIVGGALLEFSTYGAFGNRAIRDVFNRGEYMRLLDERSRAARAKFGGDLFDDARAAVEELAAAHQQAPRARDLTTYTAVAEYETQLRFGRDAARATRAKAWVDEVRLANPDARYLPIAAAAQKAVDGDLPGARTDLDAVSKKDPGDPIQQDIALMRGEVELAAKDGAAAVAAFSKAAQLAPSARAQYGLARAYTLTGDLAKARAAVNAATTASPMDAGALGMRAQLAWDQDRDETAAMNDLAVVTDGKAKAHASAIDQAHAYSLQGWIHLSRGRVAEARTAFDTAFKLDPTSVSALLGQGEVFYKEGRYSEALSHFDTAIQKDPSNPRAVVDDAKTKIALEHLADAKAQLLAARQSMPKVMQVAFWLGKGEEVLGNRKPAEAAYIAAIGLVDPKSEDAILPYMALAELLANGGRADEAAARLAEAQKNLPDSAGMQRALGEVAAVQGNYDEAIRHYLAAVTKDPKDISSRYQLGVTYRKMQKLDEAGAAFQAVADADKDYPNLSVERGLLAQQSGHVDQALEQFAAALAKAPDDVEVQLHVGEALVLIGKVEEALKTLNKVIFKKSQSAEANHFLGRAMFMQGTDLVAAKKYLQTAVDIDPNEAEYHMYVAWIANESGDLGTADVEIHKALAVNKLLPEAYWQRGALERVRAAVDDAIKDLNTALRLKPTLYQAHAELAQCYADKNDQGKAMAEWQLALTGDPDRPFWNYRYGKLLFDKGNYAAAAEHLVIAVAWAAKIEGEKSKAERPGWAVPAEFTTAVALHKSGKKADAIDHYKRFLDLASPTSPDKREALAALQALGAPYENR